MASPTRRAHPRRSSGCLACSPVGGPRQAPYTLGQVVLCASVLTVSDWNMARSVVERLALPALFRGLPHDDAGTACRPRHKEVSGPRARAGRLTPLSRRSFDRAGELPAAASILRHSSRAPGGGNSYEASASIIRPSGSGITALGPTARGLETVAGHCRVGPRAEAGTRGSAAGAAPGHW